jgi:hypothetical protein
MLVLTTYAINSNCKLIHAILAVMLMILLVGPDPGKHLVNLPCLTRLPFENIYKTKKRLTNNFDDTSLR